MMTRTKLPIDKEEEQIQRWQLRWFNFESKLLILLFELWKIKEIIQIKF